MVRQERAILTAQLIIRLGVKILMKYSKRKRPRKKAKRSKICGCNSMAECKPSKLDVEGSTPFTRFLDNSK
jgi:hypothetical protein